MELPVSGQAGTFFWAVALGAVLALVYDLLRGIRRVGGWKIWPTDLLFGLLFITSLLAFMLYIGKGLFRLYCFPALLGGALLWHWTLSEILLKIWMGLLRTVLRFLSFLVRPATTFLKKTRISAKNAFQLSRNGLE